VAIKWKAGTNIDRRKLRFIGLQLKRQEYCMHIPKWQEISGCYSAITTANAPAFIKGVINLRDIFIVPFAGLC
jgi:chemotaxis signal transduction protein